MLTGRRISVACLIAFCLAPAFCQTSPSPATPGQASEDNVAHFGTTVVITTGLRGEIYFIPAWSPKLPNFDKLTPVGTIYTTELNIPRHEFTQGFPGVTGRFEWFAIDYTGKFWVEKPGKYTWALLSDDGSRLYIDGHQVINNDGQHPPKGAGGTAKLKRGEHRIRISYFQGPRAEVALILVVMPPGEHEFGLFSTEDYLTPDALTEWNKNRPDDPKLSDGTHPWRKPGETFAVAPSIPVAR
jgi:hypothetical protein